MPRLLALLLAALLAGLASAPVALPAPPIGAGAISDLLASSDVAIDPAARVTPEQRAGLTRAATALRAEGIPAEFAVIRAEGLGANAFADAVHRLLGYRGLQVVIVQQPPSIGFSSGKLFNFEPSARDILEAVTPMLRSDPVAAATELARRVWRQGLADEAASARRRGDSDDGSGGVGATVIAILLPIAIAGGFLLHRRRRRRRGPSPVEPRVALEPLVDALAARITDLQPRAEGPEVPEEVRSAYAEAVIAYGEASEQLPRTRTAADATQVQRTVERGMSAARRGQHLLDGTPADAGPSPRQRRRRRGTAEPG